MSRDALEDAENLLARHKVAHYELFAHLSRLGVDFELMILWPEDPVQFLIDGCDATGSEVELLRRIRLVDAQDREAVEACLDGAVEGWT